MSEITIPVSGEMGFTDGLPGCPTPLGDAQLFGRTCHVRPRRQHRQHGLPSIATQLHASPAASIWVVNAFLLTVGICVVPLSSLVDIIGYKQRVSGRAYDFHARVGGLLAATFSEHTRARARDSRNWSRVHLEYRPRPSCGTRTRARCWAAGLVSAASSFSRPPPPARASPRQFLRSPRGTGCSPLIFLSACWR